MLRTPPIVEEAVTKREPVEVPEPSEKLPPVMRPVFETEKSVAEAEAVVEPMAKSVVLVSPLLLWIENLANGELVPTPMEPEVGRLKEVDVAGNVPFAKFSIQ